MSVHEKIDQLVKGNRVVLFMKGNKLFPQCGFSARAVEILNRSGAKFTDVNVLADHEVREGVKAYSQWPTIPQLFVDGAVVGGSDIMTEMYQNGELQTLLAGNA